MVAGVGGYYYLGVLFEWISPLGFLALVSLLFLYLVMYVAITIFSSALARSQLAAAGISFGILIILSLLGVFPTLSPYLPASILRAGRALALGVEYQAGFASVGVVLLIIAAAWLGSWRVLRGQEL